MRKRNIENNLSSNDVKSINIILKDIHESGMINKSKAYSMFKSDKIGLNVILMLEDNRHIKIIRVYEGDGIYSIKSTENTFDGIGFYSSKTPILFRYVKSAAKNTIIQIIGSIVTIYAFLKIIESIFDCDIPVI